MASIIQAPGRGKTALAEQIRDRGLAGILLHSAEQVYYLSGLPVLAGSGNPILSALENQLPFFVYLAADGRLTLFCWIGATLGYEFAVDEVRSFFHRESALAEVHDVLAATVAPGEQIGVESTCPFFLLKLLYEIVSPPDVHVIDDLLLAQRFCKTQAELDLIRQATAIVETTVADLRSLISVGISRLWLIHTAKRLMIEHGATGIGHTTIAFGASNPEIASDEILAANQVVTLDLGAVVDGYHSDNRRLLYTGAVPNDLLALHQTMCSLVEQVGQALRPGQPFAELYQLAASLYEQHELPPFFLSVGHSLGLQTEEAWITPDSPYSVQAGMVLNIELYTSYQDGTSIGNEETFLVTDTATVRLTQTSPTLQSV